MQDLHSAVKNKKDLIYHSCHQVNEENPACLEPKKKIKPNQNWETFPFESQEYNLNLKNFQ